MPDADRFTLRDRQPGFPPASLILDGGRLYLEKADGTLLRVVGIRGESERRFDKQQMREMRDRQRGKNA